MGAVDRILTLIAVTVPLAGPILGPYLVYKHRNRIKRFIADRILRLKALNPKGDRT